MRVTIATVRMILTAAVLVTLYYVVPMDFTDTNASTFVRLLVGAGIFVGLMSWQLREITRADYPALRAFEALFLVLPLFLLLFASTYFLMGKSDPPNFSEPLTRTDALYFTITIFSTVGFGDITAEALDPSPHRQRADAARPRHPRRGRAHHPECGRTRPVRRTDETGAEAERFTHSA